MKPWITIATYSAAGVFIFFLVRYLNKSLLARLAQADPDDKYELDELAVKILSDIKTPTYLAIAAISISKSLELPAVAALYLGHGFTFLLTYHVAMASWRCSNFLIESFYVRKNGDTNTALPAASRYLQLFAKLMVWTIAIIWCLGNLGYDITALVTGMGIGGIAIALAVQNILGDMLTSISIYIDKPFEEGDTININGQIGRVERIGLKSTRLKTLQGEQLIISNQNMVAAPIHNYKRMETRRVVLKLGVIYDTPEAQINQLPAQFKDIIDQTSDARFDRAHFCGFGDSSLDFEIVYYILSSNYLMYMNTQEQVNLGILHTFRAQGTEFAYPSLSLYHNQLQEVAPAE